MKSFIGWVFTIIWGFCGAAGLFYIVDRITSCFSAKPKVTTNYEITGDPVIYQSINNGKIIFETNGRTKISVQVLAK